VLVTDNASSDGTVAEIEPLLSDGLRLRKNSSNMGFSAGQNQGVAAALNDGFDAVLVLNPDVRLERNTLLEMSRGLDPDSGIGMVTPKLLRADESLQAISPPVLDAAGMVLLPSLRHLDRGSGEPETGTYDRAEDVFGGTGACLLLHTKCIESLILPGRIVHDSAVFELYPQLREGADARPQLFDEAFFAYREDADLAWRARTLGWRCRYEPAAVAYHVRRVVPEKRSELPPELNLYGVRNRFLLQINNWSFRMGYRSFVEGMLFRNAIVCAGVALKERTSLRAFRDLWKLWPRALRIRRYLIQRRDEKSTPCHSDIMRNP
jgi:GT2 family glycosyltransferase